MRLQRWMTIIVTMLAAIALASQIDVSAVAAALADAAGLPTLLAFACIVVNLALSFVRFRYSFRILGLRVPLPEAAKSFLVGHLGSLLIVSVVGQAVGRASILANAGVSASSVTFLSLVERMIALGSLVIFAIIGGTVTLGGIGIDLTHGGGRYLIYMMVALPLLFLAYGILNRRRIRVLFAQLTDRLSWRAIVGCFLLSVLAHFAMLGAFYAQFSAYDQAVPAASALGALAVVMFLAALPISFAGWGIRELSAAHVLGQLGVPPAIGVAVGAGIGLLSLLPVLAFFAATFFISLRPQRQADAPADRAAVQASLSNIDRLFAALMALLVPFAIMFQLRVPMPAHWLNVNLADLFAMSAAAVLGLSWSTMRARVERGVWIVLPLALVSAAIALSLLVGYFHHGFQSWAFVNRTLGWSVVLSYVGIGFLLWGHSGRARVVQTLRFVVTAVTIVAAFQIAIFVIDAFVVPLPREVRGKELEAFLQDRNAFAFQCIVAFIVHFGLRAYAEREGSARLFSLAPVILSAVVVLTLSRTGWVLLGASTVLIVVMLAAVRREVLVNAGIGLVMAVLILNVHGVNKYGVPQTGGGVVGVLAKTVSRPGSDTERLETISRGLELWQQAPLLGHGLGGYVHDRLAHGQKAQVIHNVPVWILAEMGLVGFTLIAAGLALFVRGLWVHWATPAAAVPVSTALICLAVFCLGGLTQDFFYQRMFWFVTGLLVALASSACWRPREAARNLAALGGFREAPPLRPRSLEAEASA